MNFRTLVTPLFLIATAAAAQTPAAGTVTAIPDTQRLQSGGAYLTPVVGTNQHPGFCGFFAKQVQSTDGLITNVTIATQVIDNTRTTQPTRGETARELVPVADLVNQASSGHTHTPDVRMAWTTGCTSHGGDLGGVRFAYRLRGNLNITSAGTKTFMVNSDDGYSLRIGGVVVSEYNANRGPAGDTRRASFSQPGVYPIEVVYWEQGGNSVFELLMADAAVCFSGTGATTQVIGCASGTDRSNTGVLSAAQASAFTIMGSTQVGIPTWAADDNCASRVGQPNTLCSPTAAAACGNGVIDQVSGGGVEACDDGNTVSGDGCSATCGIETGYVCTGSTSVCVPNPPVITAPAANAQLATTTPSISGTGNPGATVTVREGTTTLCTATVLAAGTWSCTSATLTQGQHVVTATQADSGGRTSAASASRTFFVDTVAPAAPSVTAPAANSTVGTNTPAFSGTAEAGSTVRVYVDGGTTPVCTAIAGVGGAWSCTPSTGLAEGTRGVRATAADAAGNVSPLSTSYNFTVDTTPPAAPTVSSPAPGALVGNATPTVSGTAEANSTVTVLVDGGVYCTATASALGAFSCAGTTPLADGTRAISARATDAVGNVGPASTPFNVTIDTVPPVVALTAPAAGANLATLSPTFSGTGENGAVVRVYVDGVATPVCTATVAGGAWSCQATLAAGTHTVQISGTDGAGNTSALSTPRSFTLDVTPPPAPVITAPTANQALATQTPTFSGTAEANSAVTVTEGATVLCTTTANASGAWSCTSSTLSQGNHTVSATARDAAGNVSPASSPVTFNVDTVAPAAPVITAPAANAYVTTTTPTLSGTAEANSTVTVREGATVLCTATASASGAWSCTSSTLSQGSHTVTATATDAAGNVSPATANRTFIVDSIAPTVPTITTPAANAQTNNTTPTFTGTGEAGTTLAVFIDGSSTAACTTTVAAGGTWSCTATTALAQGNRSAVARSTDAAGNSTSSAARPFVIDTTPPAAPVLATPANGAWVNTTTPTITGTGEVGATVVVSSGATAVCTVVVPAGGAWSCAVPTGSALAQGSHALSARQTDPAGNQSPVSNTNTVNVDSIAPVAPVISAPAANANLATATPAISGTGEAGATVSVFIDGASTATCTATVAADGTWSCVTGALTEGTRTATATQRDPAGNVSPVSSGRAFVIDTTPPAAPVVTAPAADSTTNDATPAFSGTAEAGTTVSVFIDGDPTPVCTATAGPGGAWSCSPTTALGEGSHTVTARATDAAGNQSPPSAGLDFTVDTTPPAAPVITAPADGAALADNTPTIGGTAEPGATVRVYDGADPTPLCTVVVGMSGNWSCTPTSGLTEGPHVLTATATDPAGNTSPVSGAVNVTIDTAAPAEPVITAPAAGAVLTDATPLISGTGEAGATVSVFFDGGTTAACTATVAADGAWSCSPTAALADGAHTVAASQADAAGNASGRTAEVAFTLDTVAPGAPVISSPTAGELLDGSPTVTGTAEPGSTVTVFVDGGSTPVCTVVVPAGGAWSCATSLNDGTHTVTAVATDGAGNASPPASVSFSVDSTAPDAPVILAPTEGGTTAASTTFSGTAEAGSTVRVFVDGSTMAACTTQVGPTGTWACVVNGLSVGAHTATATAQDATGNTSVASGPRGFQVSPEAPPGPPVITAPAQHASLADATPTVSGQAALLSTVRVYVDGSSAPACTATTDANGDWSCVVSPALGEGPHRVTATATVVGVVSLPSAPVDFTVDVTAPAAPIVSQPAANATVTARPTVGGTAEAGSTVSVYIDGSTTPACTATANAAGAWVCAPATALADGAHTLVARATDAAGNVSPDSGSVDFTVDSSLPVAPPVITGPAANSVIADATPDVSGTAAPLSVVDVYVDGSATPACTVTAAADGTFRCTLGMALGEGAHTLTATATDAHGTSQPSAPVTFTVDTVAPGAPVVIAPTAGEQVSRTPTVSGTAEAGSTVEVRIDGQLVCTVVAGSTGAWSCPVTQALPAGTHAVNATAVDAAGNRSPPSADVTFTVTTAPVQPVVTSPAAGQSVTDTTPTVTGTAEPGSLVTVTIDGLPYCTATADANGAFSCEGSGALGLGTHSIVVTSTTAGGTSTSDAVSFTVTDAQPMPPAAPVITSPANGAVTVDARPTFSGTAEPGSTVTVRVDGAVVCTATATAQGTFSCRATSALADGAHTATATATRDGATSPASGAVRFTVAATSPTVTSPTPGSTTGTTTDVTGTGVPGATIVVRVNGEEACRTTVDEAGDWTCRVDLPPGEVNLVVETEDGEGNVVRAEPITVRVVAGTLTGGGVGAGCSASPASASLWLAALVLGFLFSRRARGAVALAAVVGTGVAQAQTEVAPFDLERVRLNPGAADGLLQEGGALLDPLSLRVSLLGHYQHNPLVVHQDGRPVASLVGSRWTAHLGAAFGITDWLEAGLQVPVVLSQTGNAEGTGYTPITNVVALGTPYLQVRAAPLRERSGAPLDLSLGLAVGLPLGSAAALARDSTVTAIPTVGLGKNLGSMFRVGGNVSVAIRPASSLNDGSATQVGSYLTTGLVLSTTGKVVRGELSGRLDIPFTQSPVAGELYAGVRWAPHRLFELALIGGPGFGTQPGTPAFRVLAGAAFTPSFKDDAKPEPVKAVCVAGAPHDPRQCPELDLDGDGVKNADDQCVDTPGLAQRAGCPDLDSDNDGVLDLADKCPKVPGVRELDGCPEPDADNDGVADARDACPNAPGPASSAGCPDTDGDGFDDANDACPTEPGIAALKGCPDVDTDGDGVVDRLDNCVNEKGPASNQGCPAKQKQLVVITAEKLMILDKVYFASGKSTVLPKSDALLKQVARVLTEHPDVKLVVVEGHTDNVGKPDKNLTLSQARAEAVRTKLIGFGVAAERLEAKGYGDTRPLEDNKTAKGREANRRVEFVLGGQN